MIELAIDAANFVQDHRGMGRVARPVVHAALSAPDMRVTLLAKRRDTAALQEQFGKHVKIAPPSLAAKRGRFDVIWLPFNGMRYRCAAPTLVSIYDAFAFSEPASGFIARWREQQPIRRAARQATRIVTISRWSAHQITTILHVHPDKFAIVHPLPDAFFFPAVGDALPPPLTEKRFVLYVGGPEPRKNAPLIIEAAARALDPAHEMLVVVGTLSEADEERLHAFGVPHLRLRADDEQLRALYRNAALVAVPSRAEGFGLVAAEAMACGAPVIAAHAGALPEATGGDALLLDPHDVGAWAAGIRQLLDDSQQAGAYAAHAAARYAFADREKPTHAIVRLLRELGSG